MKLPAIPETHTMLCLTAKDNEYVEVNCGDTKTPVKFCIRKSHNGRASIVVIAPRNWGISRGPRKEQTK